MLLAQVLMLWVAQGQPAQEAILSGTVVDSISSAVLNKVQVLAEPLDGRNPAASTTTDEKGEFTLVRLPAGEYRLKASRNGYLETYYGTQRSNSQGIILTLAAGSEQKGLRVKLLPFAVIAGTVRDPDGEPLADARVALIGLSFRNGRRQLLATGDFVNTDDLGQYRIPYVRPGSYYVRAGPRGEDHLNRTVDHSPKAAPPPEVLVPAFAPGSLEVIGARKIDVMAGDRIAGVDIVLARTRLFHVRLKLEGPAGVQLGVGLYPRPDLADGLGSRPSSDCKAGTCEFSNVPAGPYSLVGSSSQPKMTLQDLFSNNGQSRTKVPVVVTDSDLDGIFLTVNPAAELSGRVTVPEDYRTPLDSVRVRLVDGEGEEHSARVLEDRSFSILLSQGHYEIYVDANGGLVPKSIRSEGVELLNDGLTVTTAGKILVEIGLVPDGGKIEGVIQDGAGARVVLIPESRLRHDLYQATNADQFGRYHFDTVSPGNYKLFVWQDVEAGIWFDSEFMKAEEEHGHAVTLDVKGHESITLRLPDVK